jgi:hypothetical protein
VDTSSTDHQRQASSEDASDLIWGAAAIGREIGRKPSQIYHLVEIGALEGAVTKMGHRTFVGSRRRLRNLIPNKLKASPTA